MALHFCQREGPLADFELDLYKIREEACRPYLQLPRMI